MATECSFNVDNDYISTVYFACLFINAVYEVYPPKNKENVNQS